MSRTFVPHGNWGLGRVEDQLKNKDLTDLYFSVDIETTGLIPVRNSIISLGAVVIRGDELNETFERNIKEQPGTVWDEGTREFWLKYPKAYAATQVNPVDVADAFTDFGNWVKSVTRPNELPVFLAYPAPFDFMFCCVLGNLYAPEVWPFSFTAFDVQAYVSAILNVEYSEARLRNWPKHWTKMVEHHQHIALPDAIDQAKNFIEMKKDLEVLHDKAWRYEGLCK